MGPAIEAGLEWLVADPAVVVGTRCLDARIDVTNTKTFWYVLRASRFPPCVDAVITDSSTTSIVDSHNEFVCCQDVVNPYAPEEWDGTYVGVGCVRGEYFVFVR